MSTLQLYLECLLQSKRATRCQWQRGQTRQDMGDVDWHVPIDVERAQVPAKVLIIGELSKLSAWSTNFLSNLQQRQPELYVHAWKFL
jgi:hypothetical protein